MRLNSSLHLPLILLVCLAPRAGFASVQSPPESDVRTVVERFVAGLQKKDIGLLTSMLGPESPQLATAKKAIQEAVSDPNQIGGFSVHGIDVSGDKSSVWIVLETKPETREGSHALERGVKINRTLDLQRVQGSWKVSNYVSSEEHLAVALGAAETDQERRDLITRDSDLIGIRLNQAMAAEADRLLGLGDNSKLSQALRLCEATLEMASQLKDNASIPQVKWVMGRIESRRQLGLSARALDFYKESLHLYEELGNKTGIARVLNSIGIEYMKGRNNLEALQYMQRSLELHEQVGNKRLACTVLNNIAIIQMRQGKFGEANDTWERTLKISEESGDADIAASGAMNLALLHMDDVDYQAALQRHEKALKMFETIGNRSKIADVLVNMSVLDRKHGEYQAALQHIQKSVAIQEQVGNKPDIAASLSSLGDVEADLGNYSEALRSYQKVWRIWEEQGVRNHAELLNSIGAVYKAMGNPALALEWFQRGLKEARESGDTAHAALILAAIGGIQAERGDVNEAKASFAESMKLPTAAEPISGNALEASGFVGLGNIEFAAKRYSEALANFQKALHLHEEIGNKEGVASCLTDIARAELRKHEYTEATEAVDRAATIAEQIGSPLTLAGALAIQGDAYRASGRLGQAESSYAHAITVIEQLRGRVGDAIQDRQRFMEGQMAPYYAMAGLFIETNRTPDALAYAERSKARLLIDIIESGRSNVTKEMTVQEQRRERDINKRLSLLNQEVIQEKLKELPDQTRIDGVNAQREKARLDREAFETELYSVHADLKMQRARFVPISLADCAGLLPDKTSALLEFLVSEDETYLFVITRQAQSSPELKAYQINIPSKELTEMCRAFREELARRSPGVGPAARRLYDLLLGPAAAELRGKTNLVIVPDGPLWDVPFQALQPATGRYLVEDFAVSYSPSLTALLEMSRLHPGKASTVGPTLLAFGNPALGKTARDEIKETRMDADLAPLPQAEAQVRELGKLYGPLQSKIYVGAEATKDRLESEAARARILHVAAHGIVDNAAPMYSQIVLSSGPKGEDYGLLEAWEVMNLDLKADMVVLAACDTGRGRYGTGEGMIGLSWAFFVAGAPTTVVSQWSVDASGTSELMVQFHRNLLAQMSKAEALRQAELKLLKGDPRYRHPFYWAPFVVIGNGR